LQQFVKDELCQQSAGFFISFFSSFAGGIVRSVVTTVMPWNQAVIAITGKRLGRFTKPSRGGARVEATVSHASLLRAGAVNARCVCLGLVLCNRRHKPPKRRLVLDGPMPRDASKRNLAKYSLEVERHVRDIYKSFHLSPFDSIASVKLQHGADRHRLMESASDETAPMARWHSASRPSIFDYVASWLRRTSPEVSYAFLRSCATNDSRETVRDVFTYSVNTPLNWAAAASLTVRCAKNLPKCTCR
jgi:hypothetical protein